MRRLTTILAADVVGYSRLMGEDEAGTLATLKTLRAELLEPKAAQYHGRTIKLMGDGTLMEFGSVVDAVTFAVEVQCAMRKRNEEVPPDRQVCYRIGINIGDVIVEGEDIYGDGVNVAARLEGLAEPGGICVRRNVRNQIRDKIDLNFESLGETEVKNIERPVRAFRVILDEKAEALATPIVHTSTRPKRRLRVVSAVASALVLAIAGMFWWQPWAPEAIVPSQGRAALPLPDKPSIAVLPFDNLSPQSSEGYLADGMTETLISTLARVPELFVIARNSVFVYKGKAVDVRDVGRELGVRHVLEGSLQQTGDRLRVTAQLVDATRGEHLWAERYDRSLDDIFALQDDIALKVLVSLQGKLTDGADAALRSSTTENVQAYLLFQKALNTYFTFTKDAMVETRRLLDEALALDPDFDTAKILKAWTHAIDARIGYSSSSAASLAAAEAAIEDLGEGDEDAPTSAYVDGEVSMVSAYIALLRGQHELALENGAKTAALLPNHADMLATYGIILYSAGEHGRAVDVLRKAMRLSPHYQSWQAMYLSLALTSIGDHAPAIAAAKDAVDRAESDFNRARASVALAFAYADQGRTDAASQAVERLRKQAPYMTVGWLRNWQSFRNESDWQRLAGALRAAGLPE